MRYVSIIIAILSAFIIPLVYGQNIMENCTEKHVIPQGLVGVLFLDSESTKITDISYSAALKIKKKVEKDGLNPNGSNTGRWFFREFDQHYLVFFVARYQPNPVKGKRPWGTYITEDVYRVKRSARAETALGVHEIVEQYEKGKHGIKAGMSREEVEKILGKPIEINELGPVGSFDLIYKDVKIRFLDFKAAHIW